MIKKRWVDIFYSAAAIWCVLGVVLHIVMVRFLMRTGNLLSALAVLAAWWAITLITEKIRRSIKNRIREKEKAELLEYREKFITEIPVEDERFGRIVFEHDRRNNTVGVEEYRLEKPFGRHEDLLLTVEVSGDDVSPVTAALVYLYRNSRDLLEMLYRYTLECCENYDERDRDGKLYDSDYVRRSLTLYGITITDDADSVYASLDASICGDDGNDLLGCHGITLDVQLTRGNDPHRKRIDCGLVG